MLIQTDMAIITLYKDNEEDFDEMVDWLKPRSEHVQGRYDSVTKSLLGWSFTTSMFWLREFCKKFEVTTLKGDNIAE